MVMEMSQEINIAKIVIENLVAEAEENKLL